MKTPYGDINFDDPDSVLALGFNQAEWMQAVALMGIYAEMVKHRVGAEKHQDEMKVALQEQTELLQNQWGRVPKSGTLETR